MREAMASMEGDHQHRRAVERAAGFERALRQIQLAAPPAETAWLQVGWHDTAMLPVLARRYGAHGRYCIEVDSSLQASRLRREHPGVEWRVPAVRPRPDGHLAEPGGMGMPRERYDIVLADLRELAAPARGPMLRRLSSLLHDHGKLVVCQAQAQPQTTPGARPEDAIVARGDPRADAAHWVVLDRSDADATPGAPSAQAGPGDDTFALTDIQHAYWIGRGQALALGGVSCHVYFEWVSPDLDLQRFEQAWNRIVARHGMMRAVLTPDGRQRILGTVPHYAIETEDLRAQPPDRVAARLAQKRAGMCGQVLDAERWPLFDLRATREPAGVTRLHLDLDLLMFDVQSFHILLAELERSYRDPAAQLPAIGLSFRDYLLAGRDAAGEAAYLADKAWWQARLSEIAPPPRLPLARVASDVASDVARPTFRRLQHRFDPQAWQRLSAFAAEAGLTGSSVLLTAFSEVLARWAGDGRFTLNLTHFNRRRVHPDVERLVGDFTSVLLLTVDCNAPLAFAQRAAATQAQLWASLSHTRFGGVEVLRELARHRAQDGGGMDAGSLMPVVFTSLLGMDLDLLVRGADLLGEPEFLYTCTPQVWLDHQVMVRKGTLEFNWIVIDDLFPEGMVDAMFEAYCRRLDHLAQDAAHWQQPMPAELPAAQRAVREAVNRTALPLPQSPLHAGFFRQAVAQPHALACATAHASETYAGLAARALAHVRTLREAGVMPGDLVACAMPKGIPALAAAIGIVAAGAVLVPLASDMPPARMQAILDGAGIKAAFVAQADFTWPACASPVAWLVSPESEPAVYASAALQWEIDAHVASPALDALAYIIYTSGSTGTPKGVAITHGAAGNTLEAVHARLGLTPDDRVFGISALGFDLAIYDVFGMLSRGGAVILPDEAGMRDAAHWLDLAHRYGVTVWNSVPALLAMLVERAASSGRGLPASLRWVMLSGDWIALDLPARLRALAPHTRLVALGGATEAAIWSNWFEVGQVNSAWRSIPYGFPLANQSYRVLDAHLRDCPDWVDGDLHIGGAGLASCYWRDPQRTAEAFITHPASAERMYRTGDRARYWPDGCIEFLGRVDSQVKLGGHRIELGEIEAALTQHDGIQAAAATVCATAGGGQQLAAFVVPRRAPASADGAARDAAWQALAAACASAAAALPAPAKVASLQGFQQETERLAPSLVLRNLRQLGVDVPQGTVLERDAEMARLHIAAHYRRLFDAWLRMLAEQGWLAAEGEGRWRVLRAFPALARCERLIAESRAIVTAQMDWVHDSQGLTDWIFDSAARVPSVLREAAHAAGLVFPEGDRRAAESLYQRNIVADYLGAVAGAALAPLARERKAALRVLEVGAGVGGLTAHTLPALHAADPDAEYHYTDVSRFFDDIATAKFGHYGSLRLGRYDINRGAAEQGHAPASFDAVLAANVLHNARDVTWTLRELRGLLRPGGVLILHEATQDKRLQWVTAAAVLEAAAHAGRSAPGAGQAGRADDSPLLSAQAWEQALQASGFDRSRAFPAPDSPMAFVGQQVFLAWAHTPSGAVDLADVRRHLAERLPRYMVPAHLACIAQLPLSANGKVDRKRLPHPMPHDAPAGQPGAAGEPPAPGMESTLARHWADTLHLSLDTLGRDSDFFLAGGDSLLVTRLAARLGDALACAVPIRMLFQHSRLAAQAEALDTLRRQPAQAGAGSPVFPLGPPAARTLVCVHASDGHAAAYRPLAAVLAGTVQCVALQSPGLEAGQAPLRSVEAQAACYLAALRAGREAGAQAPWHVLGWSMGAYVAVEMARQLAQAGECVAQLLLVDPAPQEAMRAAARSEYDLLLSLAPEAVRRELAEQVGSVDAFASLPPARRLAHWRAGLRLAAPSPADDDAALERMVAVLLANVTAMVDYRLPILDLPTVALYQASEHPAGWGDVIAPWRDVFPRGIQAETLAGTHWSIVGAEVLAPVLAQRLRKGGAAAPAAPAAPPREARQRHPDSAP
ncbi:non-ribosomal peptide synthetase [Ralstonia pseudosolanacearum]|uniref:non-ribosomal peptide synthetase n=1 Tax=Ralstonia pseudosolanacearum TaxID=1310165 RepID=UPI001E654637|nr:non-ribosomal peptide synthetase [Ralstonia pseudosolanacearum]